MFPNNQQQPKQQSEVPTPWPSDSPQAAQPLPNQQPTVPGPKKTKFSPKLIGLIIGGVIVLAALIIVLITIINGNKGDSSSKTNSSTTVANESNDESGACRNEYYYNYYDRYDEIANTNIGNKDPHCFGEEFINSISATGNQLKVGGYTLTFPDNWKVTKFEEPSQARVAGSGTPCAPVASCLIANVKASTPHPSGFGITVSTNMFAVGLDDDYWWSKDLYSVDSTEQLSLPGAKSVTFLPGNKDYGDKENYAGHFAFFIEMDSNIVLEFDAYDLRLYDNPAKLDESCQQLTSSGEYKRSSSYYTPEDCYQMYYTVDELKEFISSIKISKQ